MRRSFSRYDIARDRRTRRHIAPAGRMLLLVYLIVGAMIGLFAPGGIIFFILPPLSALAGMIASRWWKPAERVGAIAAIIALYFTWGPMLGLFEELLNQGPMWIFAALGSLIILPILMEAKPLIDAAQKPSAGIISLLGVLVCWAGAAAAPAYSTDRQQRLLSST